MLTVIVIDTSDEPGSMILSLLQKLAITAPKAKFLIAGRPELRIR